MMGVPHPHAVTNPRCHHGKAVALPLPGGWRGATASLRPTVEHLRRRTVRPRPGERLREDREHDAQAGPGRVRDDVEHARRPRGQRDGLSGLDRDGREEGDRHHKPAVAREDERQEEPQGHEQQDVRPELDPRVGQEREDPRHRPQQRPGAGVHGRRPECDQREGDHVCGQPRPGAAYRPRHRRAPPLHVRRRQGWTPVRSRHGSFPSFGSPLHDENPCWIIRTNLSPICRRMATLTTTWG